MVAQFQTLVACCAVAALFCSSVAAQTPLGTAWTYQGRLKSGSGPANGLHDLRFRLYDALLGGTQVGATQCLNDVNVADGLFTVALDFGAPFAGQERFLEVDVRADTGLDCGNPAGFVTLAPRQPLTAVPNALFALNADLLDGLTSSAFLQAVPNPLTLSGSQPGNPIIQGTNSASSFGSSGVYGLATSGTGETRGVWGESAGNAGVGVRGNATSSSGFTKGGDFHSASTAGVGVFASATATSGTTYGGYFHSNSPDGLGVLGFAGASSGTNYGGYFHSNSSNGYGVYAESAGPYGVKGHSTKPSGTAYGGYFETDSVLGVGVVGVATTASGSTAGVYGFNQSTSGRGVYGEASAATGFTFGVVGHSTASPSGRGVWGQGNLHGVLGQSLGTTGIGVRGEASAATGTTYGVWGQSDSPSGFGGFFQNTNLGSDFDVELAGPNGAVNTPGFVYREYVAGTPSAAIPIAYGSVDSAGGILGGTGNFTVAHPAAGQYDVTVSGETYSNAGFTVTITPVSNSPRIANVADAGAGFRVNMWNLSGTLVDNGFQFTIWKRNPN